MSIDIVLGYGTEEDVVQSVLAQLEADDRLYWHKRAEHFFPCNLPKFPAKEEGTGNTANLLALEYSAVQF